METSIYPTGTLSLTTPIALGALPADGVIRTYHATGDLTPARSLPAGHVRAAGRADSFEHRGIRVDPHPVRRLGHRQSGFARFVTTQNHGVLEFLIKFSQS